MAVQPHLSWKRPSTRLGWWAVGLATAFAAILAFTVLVLLPTLEEGPPVPGIQTFVALYVILMLLGALAAAACALVAMIQKRERSWLVWLAFLPVAFASVPVANELLALPQGSSDAARSALKPSPPHPIAADAEPFVIDTDMAADDWLAILYLLGRSDVDVKAITVTGAGEAHCDAGTRNALDLVALAGRPEIPVACGRETPLAGDHAFPPEWREAVDHLFGLALPRNSRGPAAESAVELLTRIVEGSPRKVHLVVLGPLTNVAEALEAQPTLVANLEEITVMGGAVRAPGNADPDLDGENVAAEWNFYVDPQAAAGVLSSGAPIALVPLDATNAVPLTEGFYRRLEGDRTTSVAEFVYRTLGVMEERIRSGSYYFWDPLAAAIATERGLGSFQEMPLVVLEDGVECGRTVQDAGGPLIRVAVTADRERFEALFLDAVNGRSGATSTPSLLQSTEASAPLPGTPSASPLPSPLPTRTGSETGLQGRLAFISDWRQRGNLDVWLLDLATGSFQPLTSDSWNDVRPTWSPDGRKLATLSFGDQGRCGIRVISWPDGAVYAVVPGERYVGIEGFVWTSDGKKLFYAVSDGRVEGKPKEEIWTVDLETGERQFVVDGSAPLSISPDGEFLGFKSRRRDEALASDILVFRLLRLSDGASFQPDEEIYPMSQAWSTDGNLLAVVATDVYPLHGPGRGSHVVTFEATDKGLAEVSRYTMDWWGAFLCDLAWSADGQQLLLVRPATLRDGCQGQVLVFDAELNHQRGLEVEGLAGDPRWSNDGRWVVYDRGDVAYPGMTDADLRQLNGEIWIVGLEAAPSPLVVDSSYNGQPAWRP